MKKSNIIIIATLFIACSLAWADLYSGDEIRRNVIEFLRSAGFEDKLDAPVTVSSDELGVISIVDEGTFFTQYVVQGPEVGADVSVQIESNPKAPSSCIKAVIITHGWIDKASSEWPSDIALEIRKRTDPNDWICGYFDWQDGAAVINPIDAVKYARDIAGPRLAKALLSMAGDLKHIHLIGHSAGCWAVNSAAKKIAKQTNAVIHITFLDAYVPPLWEESDLGRIKGKRAVWVEHYYTKDFSLDRTHVVLPKAYNVDLSEIDPGINEHEFPYRWYYATITGKYGLHGREKKQEVLNVLDGIDYGFARSAEAGPDNWQKSLTLKMGKDAVKLGKKKDLWEKLDFRK